MNRWKNFLITIGIFIYALPIHSQWSMDPKTNLAISIVNETQRETEICKDNKGNYYVFWRDYRNEPSIFGGDIYAQKIDSRGIAQWSANGISVVTKSAAQFDVKVIYDGSGGIYLVWRESIDLFSNYNIYAQRILLDGTKLWGSTGILLQSLSGKALSQSICVNEDGDLLVTWQFNPTAPNSVDVYAQKINRDGVIQWNNNGLIICNSTGRNVFGSKIISDQNGGAYIIWSDNRIDLSNFDVYAQRISSNGNILWNQNGITVCTKPGSQNTKHLISDNNGGAMIFWEDIQESSYNVCAQRIDSLGNKLFAADGKVLYNTSNHFDQYEFLTANNDEIFLLWTDSDKNIYAQKVDYYGNFIWSNEIPVCTTQSSVSYLAVCPSDVNGVVITWQDNRNGNFDIFCQWISSDGSAMWNNNGVPICDEVSEQTDHCTCSDNFGGAVITWADMRNSNFDIYAQNIDVRGKLGSNRYLFQKSGLNKTITNINLTPDSILIALPPLKEIGYYSVIVILDSILHPDVSELEITLTHLGITDTIIYQLAGGENIIHCYLDDLSANNISSAIPPYSGIFKPYKPLETFLSTDLNGEWIINIKDNLVGNDGILKSWGLLFNKGEITNIDLNTAITTPDDFILDQNYPNPFNPSTTISWLSPVSGWQTIKLYDALGREIDTILEGYFEAGTHSTLYIINSSLSSGIYFYQLKAGEFIQTKKMILIR